LQVEQLESRELLSVLQPQFILLPQGKVQGGVGPLATTPPAGISPSQIRGLYGFNQISFDNGAIAADGTGTTIAIIDPNNDPNVAPDLNTFDQQFSWTATGPTLYQQYGAAATFLTVVNQTGGSRLPRNNVSNAEETALDVEWAHAIAPGAKILLVEANNNIDPNLFIAAAYAAAHPGVVAVSMSWGSSEFSGENTGPGNFDASYFAGHPGVTFVAASGDTGAPPDYPATSPYALAVGGTSLSLNTAGNVILGETGWGDSYGSSTGGVSSYETGPSYQNGLVISSGSTQISSGGMRTNPDVAYDASPASGFAVYNSYSFPTAPWQVFGGTSAGTPQWAGLIAIADQGRALAGMGSLTGSTQTLPILYSLAASGFRDITTGTSTVGTPIYSAGPGYDLMTGLGVPIANEVVGGLFDMKFTVSAGATAIAGSGFDVTVQALDAFNNPATSYTGTVQFTSSDGAAVLPVGATLTDGTGVFSVTLNTVGNQTLTVADSSVGTVTGGSTTLTVAASSATHFVIAAPSTATAGSPFGFTVMAEDQGNNTVTSYNGTVTFSSTDTAATLPPAVTLNGGLGSFSATLQTAGNQTLTATDTANLTGSTVVSVAPAAVTQAATHFLVTAPKSATAGIPIVFEVTAQDQFNNPATNYAGTVSFTSSDGRAVFSTSTATLTSGTGFFAATLKTAGSQTLLVSDTAASSISGSSSAITVAAAPATHLVVSIAPPPAYPGVPAAYPTVPSAAASFASTGVAVVFTVAAEDWYGNISPSYLGTVAFTASDTVTAVVLPPSSTLAAGVGVFSATLATPGNQIITATDISSPSITGASSAFVVRGLVVTSFTPTPSGFVITFNKPFNPSTVIMYTEGSTPDDIMLATLGTQVSIRGSVLLNSPTAPTNITFVKTDLASAVGTFNPGSGLLSAGNYTVTLRSFSAGNGFENSLGGALDGKDQANPGVNYVYTFSVNAPPTAVGIPDFARGPSNTDVVFLPTSLGNGNTFNLVYTNPNTSPATGTATVTFSTIAATLQANIQAALNALPQIGTNGVGAPNAPVVVENSAIATQGANVLVTFQNNNYFITATSQVLSSTTPGVSIALATMNAPNNVTDNGIPVALSNGQNVTSGSFTLQYNPALLTISGAVSKIAGASFTVATTINNATSATAVLSLSSPSGISSTTASLTLGSLLATVPFSATASYGAKQLLHFSAEQLNGSAGPIAVTNQDAVEVAAYFGDVNDTGLPFAAGGAVGAISTVAGLVPSTVFQTLPGFTSFPDLDPMIIGGVSQSGQAGIVGNDASMLNKQLTSGQSSIPWLPAGLAVNTIGPDPPQTVPNSVLGESPGAKCTGGTVIALTSESTDQAQTNRIRDFALSVADLAPSESPGAKYSAGEWLMFLGQTARRGLLSSPTDPVDGAAENADLVGLEAYFAREAGAGSDHHHP